MKIPKALPQFEDKVAFIVVAGKQNAVFYKVSDGEIDRLDAFKIPRPRYSDHEGEFKTRGGVGSSGSIKELRDQDIIRDFLREFKRRIKAIPEFSSMYIFAPDQTKNKIKSALPAQWREKLSGLIVGNFYYRHPLHILEKIPI